MENKKDNEIDALNKLKNEAEAINNGTSFSVWKTKATVILENIYGEDSRPVKEVTKLTYCHGLTNWEEIQRKQKVAIGLINGLISVYEKLGPPKFSPKAESAMTLNLTQNQTTAVKLSVIIESVQEGLNPDQFKELKDIIYSEALVGDQKKKTIIEKLKSFGGDIASNILANILTNPTLYS